MAVADHRAQHNMSNKVIKLVLNSVEHGCAKQDLGYCNPTTIGADLNLLKCTLNSLAVARTKTSNENQMNHEAGTPVVPAPPAINEAAETNNLIAFVADEVQ